jgi:hypothetical protein
VPDPFAGGAVGAVDDRPGRLELLRWLDHLDGGQDVAVAEPHDAFRVVGVELQRDLPNELPARVAREPRERGGDLRAVGGRRRRVGRRHPSTGGRGQQDESEQRAKQRAESDIPHGRRATPARSLAVTSQMR